MLDYNVYFQPLPRLPLNDLRNNLCGTSPLETLSASSKLNILPLPSQTDTITYYIVVTQLNMFHFISAKPSHRQQVHISIDFEISLFASRHAPTLPSICVIEKVLLVALLRLKAN